MCNIAGYSGDKQAAPILLEMIRKQQYYDGDVCTGVATIHEGKIHYRKIVGDVDAIIREMNDPRISGTYCITRADVTRDLRYAKVYVSVLEDDKADDMLKALKKAAGFIRRELGFRVDLRYTPELIFERDRNIAYGVHIAQVLRDVAPKEENNAGEE